MTETVQIEATQQEEAPVAGRTADDDLQPFPDHTQLPAEDGTFVKNFLEHPQSILLTESIWPVLQAKHPDNHFTIGQDSGIYWRLTEPHERGAVSPDWYYVPNVPPTLDGQPRRSYVLWREFIAPLIVIEFVSDEEGREYDRTPYEGKFWIYEQVVRPGYYAIYRAERGQLDMYQWVGGHFELMKPNARGHYPIPDLGAELGLWYGAYKNVKIPWLRWWNDQGNLLPTGEELAIIEAQRAEQEAQRAEVEAERAAQAEERAAKLAAKLRALGIDPDEEPAA
jgi:Uma2 family endonuclease